MIKLAQSFFTQIASVHAVPTNSWIAWKVTTFHVLITALMVVVSACSSGEHVDQAAARRLTQTLSTNSRILGAESVSDWKVSSGTLSLNDQRVEGSQSLAIANSGQVTLESLPLSSVGPVGTNFSLQLQQPSAQPNEWWWGTVNVVLVSESQKLWWEDLGTRDLTGRPTDKFVRFDFPMSAATQEKLAKDYSDLRVLINLNINKAAGPWLLDALSFGSTVPNGNDDEPDGDSDQNGCSDAHAQVLGFEVLNWGSNTGELSLSDEHVEGEHALAVANVSDTVIESAPLSTLTPVGSKVTLDFRMPETHPDPWWRGAVSVILVAPSLNVWWADLGTRSLNGLPVGDWLRLDFDVPTELQEKLKGNYDDLRALIYLNVPRGSGPYLLDRLSFGQDCGTSGTEHEFVIKLPRNVHRDAVALATMGGSLQLGARVRVTAAEGELSGATSVATTATTAIGEGSELHRLWSEAPVRIASGTKISHFVKSARDVEVAPGAVVAQTLQDAELHPLTVINWSVAFPAAAPAVNVHAGESIDLAPGSYLSASVAAGGQLRLRSGAYYFRSLSSAAGGTIGISNGSGPVFIYTRSTLSPAGTIAIDSEQHNNVLFAHAGANSVGIAPGFAGILVAPDAGVSVASGTYRASIFSRVLSVSSDVTIASVPLTKEAFCAGSTACTAFCPCTSGPVCEGKTGVTDYTRENCADDPCASGDASCVEATSCEHEGAVALSAALPAALIRTQGEGPPPGGGGDTGITSPGIQCAGGSETKCISDHVNRFVSDVINGVGSWLGGVLSGEPDLPDEVLTPIREGAKDLGRAVNYRSQGGVGDKLQHENVTPPATGPVIYSDGFAAPDAPPAAQGPDGNRPDGQASVAPAEDPGSTQANTDPISLSNGEFVYTAVDIETQGLAPHLLLKRTYRSRVWFHGPLGPAWDHNYNIRLYNGNPNICDGEVHLSLGDLVRIAMRPDREHPINIQTYRPAKPGLRYKLTRSIDPATIDTDGACTWRLELPNGRFYCFNGDGLATSINELTGNKLALDWEQGPPARDGESTWRIKTVSRQLAGSTVEWIEFVYNEESGAFARLDTATLKRVSNSVSETVTSIKYEYGDHEQHLEKVHEGNEPPESYAYGPRGDSRDRLHWDGLPEYCDAYCDYQTPQGCGETAYCEERARSISDEDCDSHCNTSCVEACEEQWRQIVPQLGTQCDEVNATAIDCDIFIEKNYNSFIYNCAKECVPRCKPDCKNVELSARQCKESCKESCLGLMDWDQRDKNVYGASADLTDNLESITDRSGKRLVYNKYGDKPNLPNFDAVIHQEIGPDSSSAISLFYTDYKYTESTRYSWKTGQSDPAVALIKEHEPSAALQVCPHKYEVNSGLTAIFAPTGDGRGIVAVKAFPGIGVEQLKMLKSGASFLKAYGSELLAVDTTAQTRPARVRGTLFTGFLQPSGEDKFQIADTQRAFVLDASSETTGEACWTDAVRNFAPPLEFQIPAEGMTLAGNAGNGLLTLTYVEPTGKSVSCEYRGAAGTAHPSCGAELALGNRYRFQSCSNGARIGDSVTAVSARLRVNQPDCSSGATQTTARLWLKQKGGAVLAKELLNLVDDDVVVMGGVEDGQVPLGLARGMASLSHGLCRTAFAAQMNADGTVTIDPPDACDSRIRIVPLGTVNANDSIWKSLTLDSSYVDLRIDSGSGKAFVEPSATQELAMDEWARAISAIPSNGINIFRLFPTEQPVLGPPVPQSADDVKVLADTLARLAQSRDPYNLTYILAAIAEMQTKIVSNRGGKSLTIGSRADIVKAANAIAPQVNIGAVATEVAGGAVGPECDAERRTLTKSYIGPTARPNQKTRFVTRVEGAGMHLISYYNDAGDNLRVVNLTRSVVDDYEYDAAHNQIGHLKHRLKDLAPIEPRTCAKVDSAGLVKAITRSATDWSSNSTQCFAYEGAWLRSVRAPNKHDEILLSRNYRSDGLVEVEANGAFERALYSYDTYGRLTRSMGPDGKETIVTAHDAVTGFPKEVTEDAQGAKRLTSYTFDAFGHVKTLDRHGWGPNEQWDWLDRTRLQLHITSTEDGEQRVIRDYYPNGQVKYVSVLDGPATYYTYDAWGRVSRASTEELDFATNTLKKRVTCTRYRPDGSIFEVVDANGALWTTTRDYFANGNMKETTVVSASEDPNCARPPADLEGQIPAGPVFTAMFDGADRPIRTEDSARLESRYSYDVHGRLSSVESGIGFGTGREVRTYYDERDRPRAMLSAVLGMLLPDTLPEDIGFLNSSRALSAVFFGYDRADRMIRRSVYADTPATGFVKVLDASVSLDVASRRSTTTYKTHVGDYSLSTSVDGLGRVANQVDSLGVATSYTYPAPLRRNVFAKSPDGGSRSSSEEFTKRGALRAVKDATGKLLIINQFDKYGRIRTTQGENQSVQIFDYEAFSQLRTVKQVALPLPATVPEQIVLERTDSVYDDRGRLMSVSTGGRKIADYRYDLLGRLRSEIQPSSAGSSEQRTVTDYVSATQLPYTISLPSGRKITHTYDTLGRLRTRRIEAGSAPNVLGPRVAVIKVDRDELQSLTNTINLTHDDSVVASKVVQEFDGLGRILSERESNAAELVATSYALGSGATGLRIGSEAFSYDRRADGRLSAIRQDRDGRTLVGYQYVGPGEANTVQYGNGLTEIRTFDHRGRLLKQDLGSSAALTYGYGIDGFTRKSTSKLGDSLESLLLGLDSAGRVELEIPNVPGDLSSLVSGYIDDAAIRAHRTLGDASQKYTLDSANNWLTVSDSTEQVTLQTEPDAANAYQKTPDGAATYDLDGRQLSSGSRKFEYNVLGQLAKVTDAGLDCSYQYDGLGRRYKETCNGKEVLFAYDGANIVAEKSGADRVITLHQGALDSPVVRIGPQGTAYLLAGKDRSIRAVFDSAGKLLERYSYTAFGERGITTVAGTPTGNRFGFQGQVYDPATGLYQMRARYYAPRGGRFLTRDPIGVAGGANLYAFVGNRPGDYWDPFGLGPQQNPAAGSWIEDAARAGCDLQCILEGAGVEFEINPSRVVPWQFEQTRHAVFPQYTLTPDLGNPALNYLAGGGMSWANVASVYVNGGLELMYQLDTAMMGSRFHMEWQAMAQTPVLAPELAMIRVGPSAHYALNWLGTEGAGMGSQLLRQPAYMMAGMGAPGGVASGAVSSSGGRNIALGLSGPDGVWLEEFAKSVGGETWKAWGGSNWRVGFMEVMSDPANTIHFNMEYFQGSFWSAASKGAANIGGATDWELFMIQSHPEWWPRIRWYGGPGRNPFE